MRRDVRPIAALLALATLATPGLAGAERPHATFYEPVENMLVVGRQRVAIASLQGFADLGNPFCPTALLQALGIRSATRCAVTAFGEDDVNLDTGQGAVRAQIGTVVNGDNVVDPAETLIMTGTITGDLQVVPWATVKPDFGAKKKVLGPVAPFILLTNGQFRPDPAPMLPDLAGGTSSLGVPASACEPPVCFVFTAKFRLPFALGRDGELESPAPGKRLFYLADDGSLIRIKRQELFANLPVPRAEIRFGGSAGSRPDERFAEDD